MALGQAHWSALRLALSRALREGAALRATVEPLLVAQADAEYTTPARIGDYTDFYISVHHATAVGKQFRPDNPPVSYTHLDVYKRQSWACMKSRSKSSGERRDMACNSARAPL